MGEQGKDMEEVKLKKEQKRRQRERERGKRKGEQKKGRAREREMGREGGREGGREEEEGVGEIDIVSSYQPKIINVSGDNYYYKSFLLFSASNFVINLNSQMDIFFQTLLFHTLTSSIGRVAAGKIITIHASSCCI